ncbi:hypothetical protein K7X08_032715 [Anisodus acutangulus]|uniref:PCI domain-containing protein n=1 Tax=Anisodus acutangulus TaxID=402998 RepID=A0A9Q1M3K6_9SOLA|nr:hypothetical protein K7X08_032715 [Anisodus acutangulus]
MSNDNRIAKLGRLFITTERSACFCKLVSTLIIMKTILSAPISKSYSFVQGLRINFVAPMLTFSTSFPKYTSSVAQRNLKNFSLVMFYCANSNFSLTWSWQIVMAMEKSLEFETFVQENTRKFESDNNLGLVKQVVSSMYKRNIQRLTQTYLTLSLQDIANAVQLSNAKEAEMHVLQMVGGGFLSSFNTASGLCFIIASWKHDASHLVVD